MQWILVQYVSVALARRRRLAVVRPSPSKTEVEQMNELLKLANDRTINTHARFIILFANLRWFDIDIQRVTFAGD